MRTKRKFEAFLPATPCDADLREKMQSKAATQGKSIAEVQREAFRFFLQRDDSLTVINDSDSINPGAA